MLGGLALGAAWFLSACKPACLTPAECGGLLCGPGRVCVVRCFAGQTDGCPPGTLCNNNGDGCVEAPTSSENLPTESPASEQQGEPTPPESQISETTRMDAGSD